MSEALEGSIKKWEDIVNSEGKDNGIKDCALCNKHDRCQECPVAIKTGKLACNGTSYQAWCDHNCTHGDIIPREDYYVHEGCDECERLAQEMLDFLISLRVE